VRRTERVLASLALACALAAPRADPATAQGQEPDARQRLLRAYALEQAGEWAAAQQVLEEILDEAPGERSALLALERVARRRGTLEAVLPRIDRAVALAPRDAVARGVQLRALADLGRGAELRRAGLDWIRAAPGDAAPYREYALALARAGAGDSAIAVLRQGRAALGGPPALGTELADLYLAAGDWTAAADEWARLAREGTPFRRVVLDRVAQHAERAAPAVRLLADALSASAEPPEVRAVAAIAALYAGEDARARRLAAQVVPALAPSERREFSEELARAAARLGRPDVTAWSYALLLEGAATPAEWADAALRVARFDLDRGDTTSAVSLLDELLGRLPPGHPSHRAASALRIEARAGVGPPDCAVRDLETHARRYPDDRALARLAAAVARAYVRAGDADSAEAVLDRFAPATVFDPRDEAAVDAVRARIDLDRGDWESAIRRLRFAAAALEGPARTDAIRLATLLEAATDAERTALARALRDVDAGRAGAAAARIADLPATGAGARPGLLLWAAERVEGPQGDSLLVAIVRDHPAAPETPAAILRYADRLARRGPDGVEEARVWLERLVLEYPESALVPLARRRLEELRGRVPSS
jgi:hypothetical protein